MVKIDQYDVLHNIDPHGRNKYWLFWHKCCSSWASMNDTMSFWFFWIVSIRHMFSCSEKHGPEQHDLIRHECKASTTSIWDIKITLVILTVRLFGKCGLEPCIVVVVKLKVILAIVFCPLQVLPPYALTFMLYKKLPCNRNVHTYGGNTYRGHTIP